MALQSVELTEAHGTTVMQFIQWPLTKFLMVVVLLAIIYMRFLRRKRRQEHLCAHCGERNPGHLGNCRKCAAPLFREE